MCGQYDMIWDEIQSEEVQEEYDDNQTPDIVFYAAKTNENDFCEHEEEEQEIMSCRMSTSSVRSITSLATIHENEVLDCDLPLFPYKLLLNSTTMQF